MQEVQVPSPGQEDPLEEARQPTPVFLPGEPVDRGARWATVHGVAKPQTQFGDYTTSTTTTLVCFFFSTLVLTANLGSFPPTVTV